MELLENTKKYLWKLLVEELFEIKELQEIIRQHNSLYYNNESPIISDFEYDKLFKLLKDSEESLDIFDVDSPTKRIDVIASWQFQKATHLVPMISLDNTYDSWDILNFEKRINNILKEEKVLKYVIELKFDWLGISCTYCNWKLTKVLTRWNGIEWEDVTVNALQISSIPKSIPFYSNEDIEIRWEVVMPISSFKDLNLKRLDKWEKLFANPRNAASWSLRQIDYNVTKERNLEFYAYSFPFYERWWEVWINLNHKSYKKESEILSSWWFLVSPYLFEAQNIDKVVEEVERLNLDKPKFDFEIDWLVLKLDDMNLWDKLWSTEHHPRYAIAYKFPAVNVRAKVLDIEHSVGRTWVITPIAHLEPVNVSWVMVSRVTLHNYDELAKKDVRVGDEVFIIRAWEVIPEVVSVIKEVRKWYELEVNPPEKCPSCFTELKKDEWKVAWYCPNKKLCPAQTLGSIISFVSKHWANIEWLWDKIIELFIEKWLINDFASIFDLPTRSADMLALEWFKDKKVNNLINEIELARSMPLPSLLVALGIPQVWRKTAKVLSSYLVANNKLETAYKLSIEISSKLSKNESVNSESSQMTFMDLNQNISYNPSGDRISLAKEIIKVFKDLTIEELQEIKDIWPVCAHSIVYYFEENELAVYNLFTKLNPTISHSLSKDSGDTSILDSKSFCVTWSFIDISSI